MSKLLPIIHVLSKLILLSAVMFLVPCAVSWYFQDGTWRHFLHSAATGLLIGSGSWLATRRFERELKPRDGFILVTLLWLGFTAMSAVPLWLYLPNLSVTDAFFEAMSALTTTGATTLQGLEHLAPAMNFWRHFLSWLGGMGIIVLAVAVLPMLGIGGMQLYKAEIPGPMKETKLAPRIGQTAKNLWYVYSALTVICFVCLYLAGMTPLDALCHAFTAVALGGFSTYDQSVGYFDSLLIEAILIVFMLLGALNFATHFTAWQRKSLRSYWQDIEARYVLGLLAASVTAGQRLPVVAGRVRLCHRAAPCGVQPGIGGHRYRLRQRGLRPMAHAGAAVDAVPVVYYRQLRLLWRRHQDDPHPGAYPPELPRNGEPAAPARSPSLDHRGAHHSRAHRTVGAGLYFCVFHERGHAEFRADR